MELIRIRGIQISIFCSYLEDPIAHNTFSSDLWNTIKLFMTSIIDSPTMADIIGQKHAAIDFMKKLVGIDFKKRKEWTDRHNNRTYYQPKNIKTGDVIALLAFEGIAGLEMYGTGGYVSHVTMAFWREGKLKILESNAGSWYQRKKGNKTGIREIDFEDFMDENMH